MTGAEALTRLRLDGLRPGLEHLAVRRVDGPDVVPLAQMAAAASAPPGRAKVARYAYPPRLHGAEALTRLRLDGLRPGLEHLAVRRVDGPVVVPLAQMAAAASAPPGRARVARYAYPPRLHAAAS